MTGLETRVFKAPESPFYADIFRHDALSPEIATTMYSNGRFSVLNVEGQTIDPKVLFAHAYACSDPGRPKESPRSRSAVTRPACRDDELVTLAPDPHA